MEKVNSVLQSMQSSDSDELGNYFESPPPKPVSVGNERAAIQKENASGLGTNGQQQQAMMGFAVHPFNQSSYSDINNYQENYGDEHRNHSFYKKYIPDYSPEWLERQQQNQHWSPGLDLEKGHTGHSVHLQQPKSMPLDSNDLLFQKLNYMIHLLEQKHDEKTNNITEEIVLYSFLGIFIIFIVDSFTRVGKYTR